MSIFGSAIAEDAISAIAVAIAVIVKSLFILSSNPCLSFVQKRTVEEL